MATYVTTMINIKFDRLLFKSRNIKIIFHKIPLKSRFQSSIFTMVNTSPL